MRALNQATHPGLRAVLLSERSRHLLARPIRGRGGYQQLLRRFQNGLEPFGGLTFLVVSIEDIDTLVRRSTGRAFRRLGGFQQVAVSLLFDIAQNEEAYPEPSTGQQPLPFERAQPAAPRAVLRVIQGGRS